LRASSLSRVLFVAYVLLVAYATLYPFAGWRDPAGSAFAFLTAPWPRFITGFDLAVNFLGYLPYGLLCALALMPRWKSGPAALAAALSGALLSLLLEAAQSYVPARIASNVDVLTNLCGAAAGGLLAVWLAPWRSSERLQRLRASVLEEGAGTDLGLALLALWLFAQLNPATLLFGTGDLRDLVTAPVGARHAAELFVYVEALTTAANLTAAALLASAVVRDGRMARRVMAALVAVALAVKTAAFAILMQAEHVLAWATPGAQLGLLAGLGLAMLALQLPRTARLALAAALLMAATVLVNLSPPNPYLAATLKVWEQGHFLNFNGLTRLVSTTWPFAALVYLVYLAAARRR
jgi:VanZ family protein